MRKALNLLLLAAMAGLSGCSTPGPDASGRYARPVGGSPVIANETPYSGALRCLDRYTAAKPIRIAVGRIADDTGKYSSASGHAVTQGAALMAMSALAKAGVPMVERFDTSVADLELKYASDKLLTAEPARSGYRKVFAGGIPGSNYYLVGGITELNFNIRSGSETNGDGNIYVMNIGLDLRLVDTDTLEVVDVVSYQKQIVGHQIGPGAFDFLGRTFSDADNGGSALEPIQLAVRSVIERAMLEMMSRLYRVPADACAGGLNTASDSLAGPPTPQPASPQPASPPPARVSTAYNAALRSSYDTDRHTTDDPANVPALRGGLD